MSPGFRVNDVDADTPVCVAAERILAAKAEPMFALEKDAVGGRDPDAIHDMRVASRRLREALKLFAPVYRRKMVDTWYRTVSVVTKSLGAVRDADVFIDEFHSLLRTAKDPAERAALAYLIGFRQAERLGKLERMRKKLEALQLGKARRRFEKAIGHPRDVPETQRPLRAMAEEAIESRVTSMFGHLPAALTPENSEAQHAMRIACKELRYAVETLASCFDESFDELHDLFVRFQDTLGELHDHDVFTASLAEIRDSGDAAAAGVTKQGLDEVIAALRERRGRYFTRFRRLCEANPEQQLRTRLLAALVPAVEPERAEAPAAT
jgi:CHAD domain-containing protein